MWRHFDFLYIIHECFLLLPPPIVAMLPLLRMRDLKDEERTPEDE